MRVRYNGRIWDKDAIQDLIDTNDVAVSRALMVVFDNQTTAEKDAGVTTITNGIGFTGRDAEFLTDIANKWRRWGRWASQKQLNAVRKCIRKYHRQLLLEMAEKPGAEVIKGRLTPEMQNQVAWQKVLEDEKIEVIEPKFDAAGSW